MSSLQDKATVVLSLLFRTSAYIFLRWVPGDLFPPAIYSLFALYLTSFVASLVTQESYDLVEEKLDVIVTEIEIEDMPPTFASTTAHSQNLPRDQKPTQIIKDVEIDTSIKRTPQSNHPWTTILTGLPSPSSALLSLATLLINFALLAGVTDFVYRAPLYYPSHELSFARIGYVSPDEAKLVIREPDQNKLPITVSLRIKDPVPPFDAIYDLYQGGVNFLTAETDYTTVLPIDFHVYPAERELIWTTSNNHSGTFVTPPRAGKSTTRNDGKYTFLTTSCIIPHFPYNPLHHPLHIPGLKHLADNIPSLGAQFMLFLGDFIYVDVPKRFGTNTETYRRHYRQIYSSPDWPSVSQNLPWIHVLDDHDISNDWDHNTTGVYNAAVETYRIYQSEANPPSARKAGTNYATKHGATYFEFTEGPASFFMMDTRSYRSPGQFATNSTEKTMLGQEQLSDLLEFLNRPVPKGVKWKIVASSVPFTKNWRVNGGDTWGGYLAERKVILEAMWNVNAAGNGVGVVVLSGDRHEFAATSFPPPKDGKWPASAAVHEFSTSPLNQFYVPIKSYKQTDDEDVLIKYIPTGNSKFAAISIENPASTSQSILKFKLFVDGKERWQHVLLTPSL